MTDLIPPIRSEIAGLYLANTSQIYPQLTNGESVCTFALRTAGEVIADVAGRNTPASATLVDA